MQPGERACRIDLKGLLPEELRALVARMGQKEYRAEQLLWWIHGRGAVEVDEMTDLSKSFRKELKQVARVSRLRELSRRESAGAQTIKFLFALPGGGCVESVLIIEGKRRTACVSSQVGCALGCKFCATGRMGLARNLQAAEIIDQVLQINRAARERGARVTHVVMMGMGEPLLNYEPVVRALYLLRLERGLAIGGRRITVSTAGYVPGIRKLARESLNVGLAVSLNATTDAQRCRLMPINRKYDIAELMAASREFYALRGRRVTFEYVLLENCTDTDEDAQRLADLTRGLPCKINLIPYNEFGAGAPFRRPSRERIARFRRRLEACAAVTVTLRESRGREIDAACGQLYQAQEDAPRRFPRVRAQ